MQLKSLHRKADRLQFIYGHRTLKSVYGTGCIHNANVMFVFMNPTARNISAHGAWKGIRAPWLGTKGVWQLFYQTGLLSKKHFETIQTLQPDAWSPDFAKQIYRAIAKNKVFITNLAKCTQKDARMLPACVFNNYMDIMREEIVRTNPKHIITFGNLVSSIILGKPIAVSAYAGKQKEQLQIGSKIFHVYPTYYPIGQGRRNMPRAIKRILQILSR